MKVEYSVIYPESIHAVLPHFTQEMFTQLQNNDRFLTSINFRKSSDVVDSRLFSVTNTAKFFGRNLPNTVSEESKDGIGKFLIHPEALLAAFYNNYYLTNFCSDQPQFDMALADLCLHRNRQLECINEAIRRTYDLLQKSDEKHEKGHPWLMLKRVKENVNEKLMFQGQNDLLDWLILAIIDFHYSSAEQFVLNAQCVSVTLKVLIKSLKVDYHQLPDDFYLKEYMRLLEGNVLALNIESETAQWAALYCLTKPFHHLDLTPAVARLLLGMLSAGVVYDCGHAEFKRAMDLWLLIEWINQAKPRNAGTVHLNAYARLIDPPAPTTAEIMELCRESQACLTEFESLLKDEIKSRKFENQDALTRQCHETMADTALTMLLQSAPVPKSQAFFKAVEAGECQVSRAEIKNKF